LVILVFGIGKARLGGPNLGQKEGGGIILILGLLGPKFGRKLTKGFRKD